MPDLGNKRTPCDIRKICLSDVQILTRPVFQPAPLGHKDRTRSVPACLSRASSLACVLLRLGPERGMKTRQTETEWPGPEQLEMTGHMVKQEWRF